MSSNLAEDPTLDMVECFLCGDATPAALGIVLRNCGHSFCIEHLKNAMQYGDGFDVDRCPYPYGRYKCRRRLESGEVQFVVQFGVGMQEVKDQRRSSGSGSEVTNLARDLDQLKVTSSARYSPDHGESSRQQIPEYSKTSKSTKDETQTDLIRNLRPAKCLLCGDDLKVYKGLVLTRCFHSFCKDCLMEWIRAGIEFDVRVVCPVWMGDGSHCKTVMGKKVIRNILSKEDYELYKKSCMDNPDDKNFDRNQSTVKDKNSIKCPCCSNIICLECKASHPGVNCKDNQDQLKKAADEKLSEDAIQALLVAGEGMLCPNCQIVIMKEDGCDYVKCTICDFEICWRTRGPRWGPGGPGDTSGGCRCKVDGILCHPKCKGCH